ncbi:MAG: penicillin-binding protein 2 [Coprobacillus sp.]
MKLFNKNMIKFDGKREVELRIKNQIDNVISRRFKILMAIVLVIGVFLVGRLYVIQINQNEYYNTKLQQYNTSVFQTDTYRGNIYDYNYNRLVYNKNINCATYYAVKGIKDEEVSLIVKFLIDNVNIETKSITEREKKDYLIKKDQKYVNSLLTADELKEDDTTIYSLQLQRITEEILKEKLTDYDLKYYKLYFTMTNCTNGSIVLLEDLSIKEASIIGENSDLLRGIKVTNDWAREYTDTDNFTQVLGKVTTKKQGLPATTKDILLALDYNNDSRVGTSGIESQYESLLSGSDAKYSITYQKDGTPIVSSLTSGTKGQNVRLTIDWEIQMALDEAIESELKRHTGHYERYNNHIFVTLINPNTGAIVAMSGKQRDPKTGKIQDYAAGNYLNAYEIGSTFKGVTIYTAFKNNLIKPNTYYMDEPIYIKGTKEKASYENLGYINEISALSLSSNVYMWNIAFKLGGATYVPHQSLVLDKAAFDVVRKSAGELGLGVKTGIDVPNEALGYRGSARESGNLLDFVIGQYDTYTTVQMAQYISTIANEGKRVQPHLFYETFEEESDGTKTSLVRHKVKVLDDVSKYTLAFERVRTGFRTGATSGLARRADGYYQSAGKTGTAQVIDSKDGLEYNNRAYVGYAPYNNPQIAVACMAERQYESESCQSLSKTAFTKYFDKYGIKSE